MNDLPQLLLITAVTSVGILHTLVPDHWAPIMLLARQRGWSRLETARTALIAGLGHVVSTLVIGLIVWLVGIAVATRFEEFVPIASSILLIAFGIWMALSAWRELHVAPDREYIYGDLANDHRHEHRGDRGHLTTGGNDGDLSLHKHLHKTASRTALLLILGSSPMVEGIPAFFAAARYGKGLIVLMALCFAISTITTYVLMCVYSTVGLQRFHLGALERYGEVLSGILIAIIGLVFMIWSVW